MKPQNTGWVVVSLPSKDHLDSDDINSSLLKESNTKVQAVDAESLLLLSRQIDATLHHHSIRLWLSMLLFINFCGAAIHFVLSHYILLAVCCVSLPFIGFGLVKYNRLPVQRDTRSLLFVACVHAILAVHFTLSAIFAYLSAIRCNLNQPPLHNEWIFVPAHGCDTSAFQQHVELTVISLISGLMWIFTILIFKDWLILRKFETTIYQRYFK